MAHREDETGQELSGHVAQLQAARHRIELAYPELLELAIGGTAVGTGLNTHPRFGELTAKAIAAKTGLDFKCASNRFAALAGETVLTSRVEN